MLGEGEWWRVGTWVARSAPPVQAILHVMGRRSRGARGTSVGENVADVNRCWCYWSSRARRLMGSQMISVAPASCC